MIWGLFLLIAATAGCAAIAVLVAIAFLLAWGGADKLVDKVSRGNDEQDEFIR